MGVRNSYSIGNGDKTQEEERTADFDKTAISLESSGQPHKKPYFIVYSVCFGCERLSAGYEHISHELIGLNGGTYSTCSILLWMPLMAHQNQL